MANLHNIVVFDFETTGRNAETCDPVQVAAIVIDPRNLNIIKDSEFNSLMCPPTLTNMGVKEYMNSDSDLLDTIKWHAKNQQKTPEEVVTSWKKAPSQESVWQTFINYINKYNWKNSFFSAPMAGGMNILEFDIPIYKRLNKLYKIKEPFWKRDKADLLNICFYWFEDLSDAPTNYKMDTLREWFGLSSLNAHDALQDVKDTAAILIKFMKLHRTVAKKVQFKKGFK